MNSVKSKPNSNVKVVFDTNIYISAILTPGKAREVLELARKKKIQLLVSEAILAEIERILRIKIQRSDFEIALILRGIRSISTFVSPALKLSIIKEDDPDNRILECAFEGKARYIISGDEHFLTLKKFRKINILAPAEFLKLFK